MVKVHNTTLAGNVAAKQTSSSALTLTFMLEATKLQWLPKARGPLMFGDLSQGRHEKRMEKSSFYIQDQIF